MRCRAAQLSSVSGKQTTSRSSSIFIVWQYTAYSLTGAEMPDPLYDDDSYVDGSVMSPGPGPW